MINWIDANDWLPESGAAVLACNIYNDMFVAFYSDIDNKWNTDISMGKDKKGDFGGHEIPSEITHWTLLPPRPLRKD